MIKNKLVRLQTRVDFEYRVLFATQGSGDRCVAFLFAKGAYSVRKRGGLKKNGTDIYEGKAGFAVGIVNVAANDSVNDGGIFVQYH